MLTHLFAVSYGMISDNTFQVKEYTNNSLLQRMVLAVHYVMFHCIIFSDAVYVTV